MAPRDEQRAADADRETVAERLREAAGEGRLDLEEYDQRLGQAYAARTYGELDRLLADLPAAPSSTGPSAPTQPAATVNGPAAAHGWLAAHWRPWANVVSICVAIWAVTALASFSLPYFWPFWVAVPWGVVLAVRTAGGLRGGEPQRWAAEQERKRAARAQRSADRGPDGGAGVCGPAAVTAMPHPRARRRCG